MVAMAVEAAVLLVSKEPKVLITLVVMVVMELNLQ